MSRSLFPFLAVWFVLSLPIACSHETWEVPTNWQEIGNPDMFTCEIPAELQKMPVQSFHGHAELYLGRGIEVAFVYGRVGKPRTMNPSFRVKTEIINGRRGTIQIQNKPFRQQIHYGEFTYMTFVYIGDLGTGSDDMVLYVYYSNPNDLETALTIIRSIKIP
jgi:hypothetical protein